MPSQIAQLPCAVVMYPYLQAAWGAKDPALRLKQTILCWGTGKEMEEINEYKSSS
jgi:hypothetical protein